MLQIILSADSIKVYKMNLQVLQVATRELYMGDNLNFTISNLRYLNCFTKIADSAIHFYFVSDIFLKRGHVQNFVACRLWGIDNKLNK